MKQKDDLAPFLGMRAKTLADSVNANIAKGRHELVITFAAHQFRAGIPNNARVLIDKPNPGKFFSIVIQGRFGGREAYKALEARQESWDLDTVATVKNTWLGAAPVSSEPNAPRIEAAFEAVLLSAQATH